MKTIGMLGGMSWESTAVYYRILNQEVQKRLGGVHSASIILHSFDFAEVETLQAAAKWDEAAELLSSVGRKLALSGADFLMIACNTMHLMAGQIEQVAQKPVLHIADPLGEAIQAAGMKKVGLLGSIHTMEKGGILIDRLRAKFGMETLLPDADDRAAIHRVIIDELVRGKFLSCSRALYREFIAKLVDRGAEGIIMGCTEIPMLLIAEDSPVPMFDTTALHAMAAVEKALS